MCPERTRDFLVERRGFEPLTSVVQAPVRLMGSSLPITTESRMVSNAFTGRFMSISTDP